MSQPTILKIKVSKTGHASITFRNFLVDLNEFYGNKEHECLNEFESSEQGWPINECGAITKNDYDNYYEGPVRLVMGDEREEPGQGQHKDVEFYGNNKNNENN